jgi:hypothetical protein
VANSRRLDLDKDFTSFGTIQIELDDFKRPLCLKRDSGACLHLPFLHSKIFFLSQGYLRFFENPSSVWQTAR